MTDHRNSYATDSNEKPPNTRRLTFLTELSTASRPCGSGGPSDFGEMCLGNEVLFGFCKDLIQALLVTLKGSY
ncbi:hypothetical protein BaRGS_00007146 [Batillaria attramentaria]|uniref:Uncharacterized protein n=1 Tax=Batillaria attramentaria TaxID=370345 RepID=A0ABD0LQE4_9CAEN